MAARSNIDKYLASYAEPEAAIQNLDIPRYQHSLVIPACRESSKDVMRICEEIQDIQETLVILVINGVEPDDEANLQLASDCHSSGSSKALSDQLVLCDKRDGPDILVIDRYSTGRTIPEDEGVGLARKIGLDTALSMHHHNIVSSSWLRTTDADAILPADYFNFTPEEKSVAAVFPFIHEPASQAIELYEISMLYYAAGLRYAGSPYAYTTIGSTISCSANAYATVRGVPRRNTGEDFYLLNKLRKIGVIETPDTNPIRLSSRISDRVPIGTGRAVSSIENLGDPLTEYQFEHHGCFEALRRLIHFLNELATRQPSKPVYPDPAAEKFLTSQDFANRYEVKRRQAPSPTIMNNYLHDWFDGLKTRQFVHAMRDSEFGTLSVGQLAESPFIPASGEQLSTTDLREILLNQVYRPTRAKPL